MRTFLIAVSIFLLQADIATCGEVAVGSTRTPGFKLTNRTSNITFEQGPRLPQPIDTLLINGKLVDQRKFPTIFRMKTGGTCTAALIGKATILTAAHCVPNHSQIKFLVSDREIHAVCDRARGYDETQNRSPDWALCLLEYPVTGIRYERVSFKTPPVGRRLMLMGYGCTAEGQPTDKQLRMGMSTAVDPIPEFGQDPDDTIFTRSDVAAGDAVLCPGDSGGPLFAMSGSSLDDAREITGVASQVIFQMGASSFAATGSAPGKSFIRQWVHQNNETICGLNQDENCF